LLSLEAFFKRFGQGYPQPEAALRISAPARRDNHVAAIAGLRHSSGLLFVICE
jgi:hypothetical protein